MRTGLWAKELFTIGVILGVANVAMLATPADASSTKFANMRTTLLPRSTSVSGIPSQILSEAERATLAAHSVTLTEHLVSNGVSLSTKLQGRWPNRIRVSVKSGTFATTIILTTSSVYVNSNATTWESEYKLSSTGAAELSDRWFVTDRSDPELGSTSLSMLDPKVAERPLFEDLEKARPISRSSPRNLKAARPSNYGMQRVPYTLLRPADRTYCELSRSCPRVMVSWTSALTTARPSSPFPVVRRTLMQLSSKPNQPPRLEFATRKVA